MAIKFRIFVHGLTLFFTEGDILYAFMPNTGGSSSGNVPNHNCTLHVPSKYRTDGGTTPLNQPLNAMHLLLGSGIGDSGSLLGQLELHLPDVSEAAQVPLPPELRDSDANGRLRTRVTVPAGNLFDTESENLFSWLDDQPIRIPYVSGIEISEVDDSPVLELLSLDDMTSYPDIVLKADKGVVEVCVSYIPDPAMPHVPKPGERSPHFRALYRLYDYPRHVLSPIFQRHEKGSTMPAPCPPMRMTADPFTCVHAFASE